MLGIASRGFVFETGRESETVCVNIRDGFSGTRSRCAVLASSPANNIPFPLFLFHNRTNGGQRQFGEWGGDGSHRGFYHTDSGRWHIYYRRDGNHRLDLRGFGVRNPEYFFPQQLEERLPVSTHFLLVSLQPITIIGIFWPSTAKQLAMETKVIRYIINSKLYPSASSSWEALSVSPNCDWLPSAPRRLRKDLISRNLVTPTLIF